MMPGMIELHARDSLPHGEKIRYEPQPQKNTVGFWVNPNDWVEWKFTVEKPGAYWVDILQGCGAGSGGSEVAVEVAGQKIAMTVRETGHFQHFILREIGKVDLPAGAQTLSIKPVKKAGGAVMDVRLVRLRPAA